MVERLDTADVVCIVIYFLAVLIVGLWATFRPHQGSAAGYFLAGKNMHWFLVGSSIFASNVGAPKFIGFAGTAAASGFAVAIYEWHEFLPETPFIIASYERIGEGFECKVRLSYTDVDSVQSWRRMFEEKTRSTFKRPRPTSEGRFITYKEYLFCGQGSVIKYRGVVPPIVHERKTGCTARLIVTLKRVKTKRRFSDKYLPQWPCEIYIKWTHNHEVDSPFFLKYRTINLTTIEKMRTLFYQGYSASQAGAVMRQYVKDNGHDMNDRAWMPQYNAIWRYFTTMFPKKYQQLTDVCSTKDLVSGIEDLSEKLDSHIQHRVMDDGSLIVALISPLMLRVHHHCPESAHLVFLDSSGGNDLYNGMRIFNIMTDSLLGGLPLGCFLTNSENVTTVEAAINLLVGMLPPEAFYGRGERGPQFIMTDNSDAQTEALRIVFPEAKLSLSLFDILQATWRYLWFQKIRVSDEDKPHLLKLMKDLLCSSNNEANLNESWESVCKDPVLCQYGGVKKYFLSYWNMRHRWASCFLPELNTREATYGDLTVRTFRALSNNPFRRTKVTNVFQLLDSIDHFSRCFTETLLENVRQSFIESSDTVSQGTEILPGSTTSFPKNIKTVFDETYTIEDKTQQRYTFNSFLSLCSCPAGLTGAVCTHQISIRNAMGLHFFQHRTDIPSLDRLSFYKIASGSDCLPSDWVGSSQSDTADSSPEENFEPVLQLDPQTQSQPTISNSTTTNQSNPQTELDKAKEEFKNISEKLLQAVMDNPEELLCPFQKFMERGNQMLACVDSTILARSLSTFGSLAVVTRIGRNTSISHPLGKRVAEETDSSPDYSKAKIRRGQFHTYTVLCPPTEKSKSLVSKYKQGTVNFAKEKLPSEYFSLYEREYAMFLDNTDDE